MKPPRHRTKYHTSQRQLRQRADVDMETAARLVLGVPDAAPSLLPPMIQSRPKESKNEPASSPPPGRFAAACGIVRMLVSAHVIEPSGKGVKLRECPWCRRRH